MNQNPLEVDDDKHSFGSYIFGSILIEWKLSY